jgi:hypothetical protein
MAWLLELLDDIHNELITKVEKCVSIVSRRIREDMPKPSNIFPSMKYDKSLLRKL